MKTLGLVLSISLLTMFVSDTEGQIFRRRSSSFQGNCSTSYCPPPAVIVQQQVQYVRPNIVPYAAPASAYDELDGAFLTLIKEQKRHQYFLEKLQFLGLNRSFSNNNVYGQVQQQQVYGQAGNTVYGTSVQSLYNYVGQYVDTGSLYLQSAQLTRDASTLHGNALNGHQSLVAAAGANQARLLEILSRGEAAARVLNALEMPKTTISHTTNTWGSTPNGGQIQPPPPFPQQPPPQVNNRAGARFQLCGSCHNDAGRKEAGLNINDFDSFNASQKSIIMGRLVTNDPGKRMPRNPDGSAGSLTPDQLELFK